MYNHIEIKTVQTQIIRHGAVILLLWTLGLDWARAQRVTRSPSTSARAGESVAKPWYRGISSADQDAARKLFKAGAALHREAFFEQAIRKYEAALALWKHPEIYYNMARALRALQRPVAAYHALREATRFGTVSLMSEEYARAQLSLLELESQLAHLHVSCSVAGAQVYVDDQLLFRGQDSVEMVIVPGPHRIVARRAGYVKDEQWLQLGGGERKIVALRPLSFKRVAFVDIRCTEIGASVILDGQPFIDCPGQKSRMLAPDVAHTAIITRPDRIPHQDIFTPNPGQRLTMALHTLGEEDFEYKRPIPRWSAWAIFGGGVLMSAVSVTMQRSAATTMREYDRRLDEICVPLEGCPQEQLGTDLLALHDSAQVRNGFAMVGISIGCIAMIAGLGLELWNQPRRRAMRKNSITVQTSVTAKEIGVVTSIRF